MACSACAQPIRSKYFRRSTNQEWVILPSLKAKLTKNALFIDQSAFSNFALYVITIIIKGHNFWDFDNWLLNRGWLLNTVPLNTGLTVLGIFRFDYEYEIEYEYDFSNLVCMV